MKKYSGPGDRGSVNFEYTHAMLKFSFYNSFIKFIQKQNEKKKQNVSKNMPRHFFYSNSNSNNVDL